MAGNFYAVRCPDCENEQTVFGKAASAVACAVCGTTLAHPTGGDASFEGEVIETVERRDTGDELTDTGT
ncbi:30S ribosomal protein S27e [Halobacteriales archaeon QH_9_66_26]|nr:MAG: 30S ribosomal protein S27e [Halobacteriales archaeon QH_9_66_26]